MSLFRHPLVAPLGVLLIASLVFAAYFGGLLLRPHEMSPTYGGDGLTIHYNLQYHATHGRGSCLEAQYHPYRESIFMTDAQALVAVVLAGLRPVFPDIGRYAVAISNALIFWSNPLAVLLLFLIFRRLGVRWWLGTGLALVIAMLAPQILRQLGGQYTLGYTFLLPLVLWYQLSPTSRWRSAAVAAVIVLLGLNNPYLYAIAVAYLLAAAGTGLVARLAGSRLVDYPTLLHWVGVSVVSTLVVYGTLHALDGVDDRVAVPFGFFHNVATWGGLLTSPELFSYDVVRRLVSGLGEPRRENQLYLGLVPLLFAVALPVLLLLRRFPAHRLLLLTVAGLLGLIFAFGLPFSRFPDWTYAHLGSVLQFRAPVRFAWPLYYVLAVGAGFGIHLLYTRLRHRGAATLLTLLLLGVWALEAHQFLTHQLTGHREANAFHPRRLAPFADLATAHGIDTTRYSAIYLLPSEQGWSDKVHRDGSWRSNHDGYKLSLVTGLPLLNGKLSRVSLSQTLASLQLISHPLLYPTLIDRLDTSRQILLLASLQDSLLARESDLLAAAVPVFANGKIELRSISVRELRARHVRAVAAAHRDSTALRAGFLHQNPQSTTERALSGTGSRRVDPGYSELLRVDTVLTASQELSVWYYVDRARFGGPKFYLRCLGADGKRLSEAYNWANHSSDTYRGWLRVALPFTPPPGTVALELVGEYFYHYYLDDLQLRERGTNTLRRSDGLLLYNNFPLAEPQR